MFPIYVSHFSWLRKQTNSQAKLDWKNTILGKLNSKISLYRTDELWFYRFRSKTPLYDVLVVQLLNSFAALLFFFLFQIRTKLPQLFNSTWQNSYLKTNFCCKNRPKIDDRIIVFFVCATDISAFHFRVVGVILPLVFERVLKRASLSFSEFSLVFHLRPPKIL